MIEWTKSQKNEEERGLFEDSETRGIREVPRL